MVIATAIAACSRGRIKLIRPLNNLIIVLTVAALVMAFFPASAQRPADSELSGPAALAFDSSGNLFVVNSTSTIIKIAPDGTKSTFATGILGGAGLPINKTDDLFVVGSDFHSIVKFTPDGTKNTFATGIRNSQGLAVDIAGNLFVSDPGTGSILKFTPDGTKSTFAAGILIPRALAFDGSGNLFVSDLSSDPMIVKFAPDGSKSDFATGVTASVLTFDKVGNLLVRDVKSQSIIKFTPDGTKSTFATGIIDAEGLAFDRAGNLFVSDSGTGAIFKFTPDGTKSVFLEGRPEPAAAEPEPGANSSAGLPDKYAKDYLVASNTISPDKKFAVIYPTRDSEEFPGGANYLVSLKPFAILGKLDTKRPYFKSQSHGGLTADWSKDGSVALITLDSKWGPGDIFLLEFREGRLARTTNLLTKMHDLLVADYRKAKAEPYNEYFDFIFESEDEPICKLDGTGKISIDGRATTDPKGAADSRVWDGRLVAVWNIAQAKFTSQKVSGRIRPRVKED